MTLTKEHPPVLMIGIEVGNYALVDEWIRGGELPTLAALVQEGGMHPMSTVTELSSGSIWPSFYTGANPLRNGQFFTHMQLKGGTYRIRKKYADDVPVDPFWAFLGMQDRRVFTFDVPQTRPLEGFNGVNLCGWGSEYPAWPRSSWPKHLMPELVGRYGDHPLLNAYRLSISPETQKEYSRLYSDLLLGLERKGRICADVLGREPWDLALILFPEVHWAMHLLWQTYDRSHPKHDPNIELPFHNIFLDLYKRLDAWIGRFMEQMHDSDVVVFSGSGLGPNYSGWHLLPDVLARLGLCPERTGGKAGAVLPMQRWGASKIRRVEDTLSLDFIEFLKRIVPARLWDHGTRRILYAANGWAESKAFALPNDYTGAIRINLKGREPKGTVEPGVEYDQICRMITEELKALVSTDTRRPVVSEVVRLTDLYPGQDLGDFPDLVVKWTDQEPITSITSHSIGTVTRDFPERRSGAHRNDCFLISTRKLDTTNGAGSPDILDLAPTIFALMGAEPPAQFDGRSLIR